MYCINQQSESLFDMYHHVESSTSNDSEVIDKVDDEIKYLAKYSSLRDYLEYDYPNATNTSVSLIFFIDYIQQLLICHDVRYFSVNETELEKAFAALKGNIRMLVDSSKYEHTSFNENYERYIKLPQLLITAPNKQRRLAIALAALTIAAVFIALAVPTIIASAGFGSPAVLAIASAIKGFLAKWWGAAIYATATFAVGTKSIVSFSRSQPKTLQQFNRAAPYKFHTEQLATTLAESHSLKPKLTV